MRLGDLDALMELFSEQLDRAHLQTVTRRTGKTLWSGIYGGVNWGRNTIADAPTIDAVPVVRCGACEYYEGGECVCPYHTKSDSAHFYPDADDFCFYGERRGGDTDG